MLKTFRRFFTQRTPVEFEVYRRENPADSPQDDPTAIDPPSETPSEQAMDVLEAVAAVRSDLKHHVDTHDQIAQALTQIEPLGQQVTQRLDLLASHERQIGELVHTFSTTATEHHEALQGSLSSIQATTERQVQVLTVVQEQIDRSQNTMHELTQQVTAVGSNLGELVQSQKTTAVHTKELVDAVRDQVRVISLQQRRTFMMTISVLVLATIALIVAIILAAA